MAGERRGWAAFSKAEQRHQGVEPGRAERGRGTVAMSHRARTLGRIEPEAAASTQTPFVPPYHARWGFHSGVTPQAEGLVGSPAR
jgi:hypothetical protein